MAQKKCPKCGENNPPEAVMCWACYTALSAGNSGIPASSALPGAGAGNSLGISSSTKKSVEPWQLGVIGVGLLAAVLIGGNSLMGGGEDESSTEAMTISDTPPKPPEPGYSSSSSPATTAVNRPVAISTSPGITPAKAAERGQMSFTISVPPRRGVSWATMAIVPTQANVNPQTAASLAASARQQITRTGKWTGLYIYVFNDQASAARLRAYQSQRNGQPLDEKGYQELRAIWPNALARYEYSKGWEAIRYPSANPTGWWQGQSTFGKAKL